MMEDYKGNSFASRNTERKTITPVTNANVKKSLGKKLFEQDAKTAGVHVFDDVVIPTIKKLISDAVKNAIDWIIYGVKGEPNKISGLRNISYSSYYDRKTPSQSYTKQQDQNDKLGLNDINAIVIPDRGYAEEVLLRLKEILDKYGTVCVADYYELVNCKSEFTAQKYGWRDLSTAQVIRNGDGYGISFPKIIVIDD